MPLLCLTTCGGGEDRVELSLTAEQRDTVNARVIAYLDSLRPALDSVCTTTYDYRLERAVDSIVQRRLEGEARLRNRLSQ